MKYQLKNDQLSQFDGDKASDGHRERHHRLHRSAFLNW